MEINYQKKFDYETKFHLTAQKERYIKFLTHYESLKKTSNIKGDIVECGVFKGTSITRFAQLRDILKLKKRIIGFDNFDNKTPGTKLKQDFKIMAKWKKETNGAVSISADKLRKVFNNLKIKNYQFIKGDVCNTVPIFIKNKKNLKILILNIDIDFFESTKVCLEAFFPYVSKGGIILLDNYKYGYGETKFIKSFFKYKNIKSYYGVRPFYVIK